MNNIILIALEQEAPNMASWDNVFFTGVGKVNAAIQLTSYLLSHPVSLVINYGTAGSRNIPVGELVKCTKFVQRDMDKTALGFKLGETAYETTVPMIIDYGEGLTCGTGDNFVQDVDKELDIIDVFDMEAYALAKVCYLFNVPFVSYKYISDNADDDSPSDWEKNLADGILKFEEEVL